MFFHFVPASYSLSDLSLRASPWSWATIELGMTMAGLSRNLEIWNCPSLSQLLSSLKGSYFAVVFDCNCQTAAEYVAEMKEQEEVGLLTPTSTGSSSCIVNFVCDSGVPFVSMLLLTLWVDCVLLVRMFCSFVFTISLCQQLWVQNNRYYRDDLLSWFLPWRAIELVHNCLGMSWFRMMESTTDILSTVLVDGADCKLVWQSYRVETLVRKNVCGPETKFRKLCCLLYLCVTVTIFRLVSSESACQADTSVSSLTYMHLSASLQRRQT